MTTPRRRSVAVAASTTLLLAALGSTPAVAAPVAGAQTSGDSLFPNVGNGGYDVEHYDLDLAYDADDGSIDATTTIDATAPQALSSFSLDFEGLTIGALTVDGVPAAYERVTDVDATKHKLVVTPATPVSGDFTTVVTYSGVPTPHIDPDGSSEGWIVTDDGATVVNEPVGAMTLYPNNNTMKDKATFDVALTVPTTIDGQAAAAVSNGELTGKVVNGATTTWSWKQTEQMATYLSMISIGQFTVHEGEIELGGGRTIPEYSFIDSGITGDTLDEIEENRALLGPMLRYLEARFGRYPGNSIGVLVDDTDVGYALETQDRPFFEGGIDTSTLLHELAHQWFGNDVSATDWSDLWLAEGPATFLEAQYAYDTGATTDAPEAAFFARWKESGANDSVWTNPMAGFTDPADLFGDQTYERGAQSLQVLSTLIGPQAFSTVMSTWTSSRSGSTGSTADWIALAEKVSGRDLTAFYQDWAFDTDKPVWPETLVSTPAPTVSGDLRVGRTLTAVPGTWDAGVTFAYQWLVGGDVVPGATRPAFVLSPGDLGQRLSVRITGTGVGQTQATRTSASTVPVRSGRQALRPTPKISGTATVGRTLRVQPGTWDAGTRLTYRWYVDGHRVKGGADGSLRVPRGAVGDRIRVRVVSTKPGFTGASGLSAKTSRVR